MHVCSSDISTYSLLRNLKQNSQLIGRVPIRNMMQHIVPGKSCNSNAQFTLQSIALLFSIILITWLYVFLLQAGDIHPNPGPSSNASDMHDISATSSLLNFDLSNLAKHMSFVHYNVQSLAPKLDVLAAELFDFDILAFTETWLNETTLTDDLMIDTFNKPERNDRLDRQGGGVIVYVKQSLFYKRRKDLEIQGLETIWIEVIVKHKHILFGTFYRPPTSDSMYFSKIEDSIYLAIDTGINDIIITGEVNSLTLYLNIQP